MFGGVLKSMLTLNEAIIDANYWINRPPILVRTVPVIPVPNVPLKLKKDSRLAE